MARKTNVTINGRNYYRVRRVIGYKADGSPIIKPFYGSGEKEANDKADEYINKLKVGLISGNQTMTINILLPKWLFNVKKNELKSSSFVSYYSTYKNYIEEYLIGSLPINEIKSLKIQEFYKELENNKVSINNIKKVHKLLRQFFGYADKEGYLTKNPCLNVSLPKPKTKDVNTILSSKKTNFSYFSEDEIKILKKSIKGNKYEDIILFALGTGMREGEILGLQWNDIDFENKEINITNNLSITTDIKENGERNYKISLIEPKTQNSIRTIPMCDTIFTLLKSINNNSNFVFTINDEYINPKILQKNWKKILSKNNIPFKKFHDLRHTFATLLLSKGANLITVKELLGHSSVKITEMYLDALPKTKVDTINKIDSILN